MNKKRRYYGQRQIGSGWGCGFVFTVLFYFCCLIVPKKKVALLPLALLYKGEFLRMSKYVRLGDVSLLRLYPRPVVRESSFLPVIFCYLPIASMTLARQN